MSSTHSPIPFETTIREKCEIQSSPETENTTPQSLKIKIIENTNHIIKFPSNEDDNITSNSSLKSGRWSEEEHQKFIEGILEFGNEWKKVQKIIKTRTSTQARSHAQKFFLRIKKSLLDLNKNYKDNKCNISNIDAEVILNYVIDIISNEKKKKIQLTNLQKERLISVINCKFSNENITNCKNDIEFDLDSEKNNFEYENLSYQNKKSNNGKNKIFNIKKDISHRKSIEKINDNNHDNLNDDNEKIKNNNILEKRNYYEEMKEYFVRKKSLNSNINSNNNQRERFNSTFLENKKNIDNPFGFDDNIYNNFFPSKKRKISEQISTKNNIDHRKNTFQTDFIKYYSKEDNNNTDKNCSPYLEDNNLEDEYDINMNFDGFQFNSNNDDTLMKNEPLNLL
jgi:SHAQKYF class myb-like DNA-binding protein